MDVQRKTKAFWKSNKVEKVTLSDVKICHTATVLKRIMSAQTNGPMKQNRKLKNRPIPIWKFDILRLSGGKD